MPSTLLPIDLSIRSQSWYAFPAGLIWAILAGTAWIACNFNMAQRLLAAKNEEHAQKAMLFTGAGATVLFFTAYVIGVCVNRLAPELEADKSYVYAILNLFPTGVRGLMIAGLLASLISTIDGLLTASGTLVTQDIFLRFIRPGSTDKRTKQFSRMVQALALILAFLLIPLASREETVTRLIQDLVSIPLGVIIAVFLLAVLSTRAAPWATFAGALSGTLLMVFIYFAFPDVNFLYRGIFGFLTVILVTLVGSRFEKAPGKDELKNLTVFTLEGAPGPWVGLHSWQNLWKWILGIVLGWFGFTALWEWMIRL
jgi:SSS family solute:Na+ symporter